jgi:uncharacterized SAM-binding protein YcdF (DUF218 family)
MQILQKTKIPNKPNKWIITLFLFTVFGLVYVGILHYKMYQHSRMVVPNDADYIIILGARVRGTEPSLALQYRIDAAAEYLKHNKRTIAIASGGKGSGEEISEAEAIKNELLLQGIQDSRIVMEDQSTDTYENIKLSKKLLPEQTNTGLIVTNDFHVYRAKQIAEDNDLLVTGLPAKTPASAVLKSYIREYLAITKYYFKTLIP